MINTHASLFSGIGGAELAATWMGWQNLFHCEIQEFPRRVLEYWYPNSISYEDITKTDFTPWQGKVDVLTGGFPCQPFSCAGKRKGADDDRYLWPEMLRAIREIQPSWVVGENVAGLLSMVQPGEETEMGRTDDLFEENYVYRKEQRFTLNEICEGLERAGYAVQPFVVPACAVGAPHRRDRVWIIARRIASDSADTRSESMQCGQENGVRTAGAAADSDLDRQRGRTHQQVTDSWCQGTSDDCTCCEDGAFTDTQCCGGREIHEEVQPRQPNGQRAYGDGRQRPTGDPDSNGLQRECFSREAEAERRKNANRLFEECSGNDRATLPADRWRDFPTQSPVCRGDDGIPGRLAGITFPRWRAESIKALGNAMVPQVVYEIFRAMAQVENENQMSI